MTTFALPHFFGSTEKQLQQIYSYLYVQAEKLNYNLESNTVENFWKMTANAAENATNPAAPESEKQTFQSLKALIVKSAYFAQKDEDEFTKKLFETYLAKSEYGLFKRKTELSLFANSQNITGLFKKYSEVQSEVSVYKEEMSHYIKTGYFSDDVFGVEIGLLFETLEKNGETIENKKPKKIRITPDKLSLFSTDKEVAYIEEDEIYFPQANIQGGSIKIGDSFSVTNKGVLTASEGTIANWKISQRQIYQSKNGYKTIIAAYTNDSEESRVFHCVDEATGKDTFKIRRNGELYASEAVFQDVDEESEAKTKVKFSKGVQKFFYNDVLVGSFESMEDGLVINAEAQGIGLRSLSRYYLLNKDKQILFVDENGTEQYYYHEFLGNVCFDDTIHVLGRIRLGAEGSVMMNIENMHRYIVRSSVTSVDDVAEEGASRLWLGTSYLPLVITAGSKNIYAKCGEFHFSSSNIYTNGTGISDSSDSRLKNSIESLTEHYENVFFNLRPVTFKYNDGNSGRKHLGFIADEVEKAIIEAELTTQNFAAFVKMNSEKTGLGGYELGLRYSEFVALNTHMIQKCFNEIEKLILKIRDLEERIVQ